ncbi:MAG: hypothetical protein PHQ75_03655 [Thermoguttaceae bacterium]|nr:hypothetical protein [Thermoguttaceae bacterium]
MNNATKNLCPGGRNKSVDQCCPHLAKELAQINTIISGNQFVAGLNYVNSLLKTNPGCACLIAAKCEILRLGGKVEEFQVVAADFAKAEPENVRALSLLASAQIISSQFDQAIKTIVKAVELNTEGRMSTDVVLPMLELSTALVQSGICFAAVPYMEILEQLEPASKHIQSLRQRFNMSHTVPYVLREYVFPVDTPQGFPQPQQYEKAVSAVAQIRWNTALELFESFGPLADEYPDIYRAIAILHFWAFDRAQGCEAILKYINSPKVSLDDRVDAWMIYSDQRDALWGDPLDILTIECPLNDESLAMENLLSSKQLVPADVPHWDEQSGPRPRKVFHLLDRPFPEKKEDYSLAEVPRVLCSFLFYGRTTDHAARIVVPEAMANDREKIIEILKEALGTSLEGQEETAVVGQCSRTINGLQFTGVLQGLSTQARQELEKKYLLEEFCPAWVLQPLGMLDDSTPAQLAQKPEEQYKLLAAVEMFHGLVPSSETLALIQNKLRSLLNLPQPEPIVLPKDSRDEFINAFTAIPFWRWNRIDFSGLDVDLYITLFQLAMFRDQHDVVEMIAKNILINPMKKDMEQIHFAAMEYLTNSCINQGKFETAAQYVEQAKELAAQTRLSDGHWNVYEFVLAVVAQKPEAQTILQHILQDHRNEERTMASLQQYMIQLGLISPQPGMQQGQPEAPQPMAPTQPAPEAAPQSQGLWTPDSDNKPSGGNGGSSKLWVPGS